MWPGYSRITLNHRSTFPASQEAPWVGSVTANAQGNADSPGFARVNCPLTDVLRLHRFNTPSSVYLQIDLYDGKCLAWALSGFGEMEDAADLMRGGVGLDVVGGDDCLHPFRHRLVFPLCQRRKV